MTFRCFGKRRSERMKKGDVARLAQDCNHTSAWLFGGGLGEGSSATMGDIEGGNGSRARPVKDGEEWLSIDLRNVGGDPRNTNVRTHPAKADPAQTIVDAIEAHGFLVETSARTRLFCAPLLKSGFRLVAIPLAVVSAMGLGTLWKPGVLILKNGRQIAVSGDAEQLHLMRPKTEKFSTGIWKRAFWPELVGGINGPIDGAKAPQQQSGFCL